MVLFNYSTKELTAKIVFYGPGLCGKTTNLQFIHQSLPESVRGKMLSLATKTDRTLFFDFLPMDLGEIRGMHTRMQLYTVPGQVFYNETRKLVLKGGDGIVFVADSQKEMLGANIEAFRNLEENLKANGFNLAEMPHVIQFNKRDLPKLSSIEELNAALNKYNAPFYESVATTGIGVHDTLKAITKLVLLHLTRKYETRSPEVDTPVAVAPAPTPPPAAEASSDSSRRQKRKSGKNGQQEQSQVVESSRAASDSPSVDHSPSAVGPIEDREIDAIVSEVGESANAPVPAIAVGITNVATAPEQCAEIRLTEIASDDALFLDPMLEVARLEPGQTQEILIPVELTQAGAGVRRFKLALKLRLDALR